MPENGFGNLSHLFENDMIIVTCKSNSKVMDTIVLAEIYIRGGHYPNFACPVFHQYHNLYLTTRHFISDINVVKIIQI